MIARGSHKSKKFVNALSRLVVKSSGAILPRNMSVNGPLQFREDSLDKLKESCITGHSVGFHATQLVSFQQGPPPRLEMI